MACGILAPWPEIKFMPFAVEVWGLNHWTSREVLVSFFQIPHISAIIFVFFWPHSLSSIISRFIHVAACCYSVTQSCLTLCNPMDYIAHQASLSITISWSFLKLMSIESVMPSNHLVPSLPAFNLSQNQGLFQWVSSLYHVVKVLELQLHQSFQWIFRVDVAANSIILFFFMAR